MVMNQSKRNIIIAFYWGFIWIQLLGWPLALSGWARAEDILSQDFSLATSFEECEAGPFSVLKSIIMLRFD